VAFDPSYLSNGRVYVYYTVPNGPDGSSAAFNRISRFTAVDADPGPAYVPGLTAAAGSEVVLLNLEPLTGATNHNGGAIHFGPDGRLYAAVGENASSSNSQTLSNLKGKILRLSSDGSPPSNNPFFTNDNIRQPRDYIWALGLRNPFTTAFDFTAGLFYINDVGQNTWEEVNQGVAGANYGWPTYEGPESDPNFGTPPIYSYSHFASGSNGGEVVSGGTFYRSGVAQFPSQYVGKYFFADGGRGWIRTLDPSTKTSSVFATSVDFPVDLKVGPDGSLYYLERGGASASVWRISHRVNAVTGIVFNDLDGDGVRDAGEPGLANWRVFLDNNNNGVWSAATEPSLLTAANGGYTAKLPQGTYRARIVLQAGWVQTRPAGDGSYAGTLGFGQTLSGFDFGVRQATRAEAAHHPAAAAAPAPDDDARDLSLVSGLELLA
jgi:glucose/arabinose dehydrogenase